MSTLRKALTPMAAPNTHLPGAAHSTGPDTGLRILHVLEATIGGTKRHLLELSTGLRARGWDVEVACPRVRDQHLGDTSFWDDLARAGVPAHEVPMRRAALSGTNAAAVIQLAGLIRRRGYTLVHAHSSVAGAVARPAALLAGLHPGGASGGRSSGGVNGGSNSRSGRHPRVVYTPHGLAFLVERGVRRSLFQRIEQVLGRATDALVALSDTEAAAVSAHGVAPPGRVTVVPNGVLSGEIPSREEGAELRRSEGWGDGPLVGTISRMTPQKDPFTWLEVAARVRHQVPGVRFLWVWGGEMETQVRARAHQLGLDDCLTILGYRPDARRALAALNVFLLTSIFEGLPYSPIEALATGTPVVATDVVGTRDVVRHNETGLLAPSGNVGALAEHVLHLLQDTAVARRLGLAGQKDVFQRFSVERMVDQTEALYRRLLSG